MPHCRLGRCIRHQSDYGALFLFDERWSSASQGERYTKQLAKWMRDDVGVRPPCDSSAALHERVKVHFQVNEMQFRAAASKIDDPANDADADDDTSDFF